MAKYRVISGHKGVWCLEGEGARERNPKLVTADLLAVNPVTPALIVS